MSIRLRIHGSPTLPTLIYLPGMHGDWTLVQSFRHAIAGQVRFVEMEYPRTTNWLPEDYAREIEAALIAEGVGEGWVIGESFGSQVAWAMTGRSSRDGRSRREEAHSVSGQLETPHVVTYHHGAFRPLGLILAGGFVKHPWPRGAKFLRGISGWIPSWAMRALLGVYSTYAHFRHRHAPETLASVGEFVANRFAPGDKAALQHRYTLIAEFDPRPVAAKTQLPVYHLAGLIDPLVPNALVHCWLKRNCPGFRESRTILSADHNVLGSSPQKSLEQILKWIRSA